MPAQTPSVHVSSTVHESPSSQLPGRLSCAQVPVRGAQLSTVHAFMSSQSRGGPAEQRPATHVSPSVQASPSSQLPVRASCEQSPVRGAQASSVHGFMSSQSRAAPEVHLPAAHTSPVVHALPSSQVAVLGV